MEALLQHPAVQAGLAPLLAALIVAVALGRTRLAWLAIVAAYATMVALTTGFSFTPLTAGRKVTVLVLLAPLVGLVLDRLPLPPKRSAVLLATAAGLASVWVFFTVLAQREPASALFAGLGVALFVGLLWWLVLRLRDDGPAAGAAGVALGVATGVGALLSASTGYLMAGIALAAGSSALQLAQLALRRALVPGYLGAATIGAGVALVAGATLMTAQLPWHALPLLLLVPLAAAWPLAAERSLSARIALRTLAALAAAVPTVAAAWFATLGAAG